MFCVYLFVYRCIFYLAMPFVMLRLYWRGRNVPGYRSRWGERFGRVAPPPAECAMKLSEKAEVVWLHAVSVGEVRAAVPLVNALLASYPDKVVMVTCTTPTGSQQVKDLFADRVWHSYLPYDVPFCLKRFFAAVNPKLLVIMETELWPCLINLASKKNIPVFLANARLSLKSTSNYLRIKKFIRPVVKNISQVAAQSAYDAVRFHALGVSQQRMMITGNLKYDMDLPIDFDAKLAALKKQVWPEQDYCIWTAGSVHVASDLREFKILLDAYLAAREKNPDIRWILAPRHVQQSADIKKLLQQSGLKVQLRSKLASASLLSEDVLLVDTMGELLYFYALSRVAFVGGSLLPVGGHNLLEPAALAKPVVSGPFLQNFVAVRDQLLQRQALTIVEDASSLQQFLLSCVDDANFAVDQGIRAQEVVAEHKGALQRHMQWIAQHLTFNS